MTVVRYQTCYTNSTEGTICGSIWKHQQPATAFLHDAKNHKYWIAMRHYACYRSSTNNKLTFFQKVLAFSDGKQFFLSHVWLFSLMFFYSALTQQYSYVELPVTEYNGHLQLKCSTAEQHIKKPCFYVLHTAHRQQNSFTEIWWYSP